MSLQAACPEQTQVLRYLCGQAAAGEAAVVQAHLQRCASCRDLTGEHAGLNRSDTTLNDPATAKAPTAAPAHRDKPSAAPAADAGMTVALPTNGSMDRVTGAVAERDMTCQLAVMPHDANAATLADERRPTRGAADNTDPSLALPAAHDQQPSECTVAADPHWRQHAPHGDITCEFGRTSRPQPSEDSCAPQTAAGAVDAPPSDVTGVFNNQENVVQVAPAPTSSAPRRTHGCSIRQRWRA